MKISLQQAIIPGLAVLCGIAAIAMIPAVHLPGTDSGTRKESIHAVSAPSLDSLNEAPPSMPEVVAKHLFIPQRKATGQNSFPDLVVKGVFLGAEKSVVFSLKSNPQANLRVWEGHVDRALSQIIDPHDPRQPIAEFLREWNIKDINFSGVTVSHFITGETETYAVNYTPLKKVKDDAERGYGQGIIPQNSGTGPGTVARTASGNAPSRRSPPPRTSAQMGTYMADRVSAIMKRMNPNQRKQFIKRLKQDTSGISTQNGAAKNSSRNIRNGSGRKKKK